MAHTAFWALVGLAAGLWMATGAAGQATVGRGGLYEEDPSASNPARTQQARELDAYLARLVEEREGLSTLFQPDFASPAAYETSTRKLRRAFAAAIGYPPPGKPDVEPPQFAKVGEDAQGTYYRTSFPFLPGVHTIGLYIVPRSSAQLRRGRRPLVISMHGGGGSPELATFHGGANYHDLVRGAVERGYVVWAPQHLFGADGFPPDIRQRLDSRARLAGTSITAIEVARLTRGLDVVLKRPEVDQARVAMVGLSYGGFYTLYTTALEPRIKVAVSSCWFGDQVTRLQGGEPYGWPDVRFPGGLSVFRDPEIVAMICPRPLEVQVGDKDELFPIDRSRAVAPLAASYYERLGLKDRFRYAPFAGGHEFHGETAWQWLARWL